MLLNRYAVIAPGARLLLARLGGFIIQAGRLDAMAVAQEDRLWPAR
jgi:hypothetical protein